MSTATNLPSSPASRNRNNYPASSRHIFSNGARSSIFKNAKNPHIRDSSFIGNSTNVYVSGDSASSVLKELYDQVASNAILNAGGRADEVKCYPGTREEVIGLIERWMDGKDGEDSNMMWLSGPAGAGKSAIVQTIAERCKERGVPAASFFFFRADPTRSTAQPLAATLLYQIFKLYPPARQAVATIVSNDPLLFDASIQDQFSQLLSTPLEDISHSVNSPARRPIVLLIDGLDECDSQKKMPQRQILQALDNLLMQKNCPFLLLVASRAEPHITMAVKQLSSPIKSIFLDEQYKPEKDIQLFVVGEFSKIKKAHHLAHTLSAHWPSDDDIDSIVEKSSGQFIFAATVMRYIADSSASPKLSLERVHGIAQIATNSPFAHLDAIYTYILSQADDRNAVIDLLSTKLLNDSVNDKYSELPLKPALRAYNPRYSPELLDSCVSDLTAIMQFKEDRLVFFHASLPDFLTDKFRAVEYHIDVDAFGAKILAAIWMKAPELFTSTIMGIRVFNSMKTPTPEITMAFQTISPASVLVRGSRMEFDSVLASIHRLYYPRDIKSYKKILRQWVSWYVSLDHPQLRDLKSRSLPHVMTYLRISQIEHWVSCTLRTLHIKK